MPDDRAKLGLPVRPFLYTLDQVSTILNVTERTLKTEGYLYYVGRTPGVSQPDELRVVNIALITATPNWRVEERELIRWMKRKGFRYIDR